ncbi:hypothetical protein H072_3217 [Dactylellina haptotyla CBS 200.50]|uniref:Acyl-coenzyme A diphosphatase SCS3 n=1 Tax=Dactylellina haptotyla (strain CBS 200.50) TaxID=1284197 RepID=S8AP91_DACHA|nr:hypothetical protein H072_3217 [Dactylellina haptotyla CBS 200.50]
MSYDRDRDSSSSGPEIATPTTSNPPSPQIPASQYAAVPPSAETHKLALFLLASIYPTTILLGSLFSVVAPNGRSASYFSRKNNMFNVFFVKIGWFWTTAAFLVHIANLRHPNASKARIKAVMRWVLATAAWVLVTQWFFGPPLMDRAFAITGGACRHNYDIHRTAGKHEFTSKVEEAFTSAACKVAGGKWDGGHDLSGHAFMLTHASLFLWAETLPRLIDSWWRSPMGTRNTNLLTLEWYGVHWFVWGILGLWWWMLLMTSVYFHTWPEKVTGWFVALFEWGLLYAYMIPQTPQVRQLFGTPTV